MPWQHLLQFVRKYHMPLVVADHPDEEALIVLPLSSYEELMRQEIKSCVPSRREQEPVTHVPIGHKNRQPSLKDVIEVPLPSSEVPERDENPSVPLFESRPMESSSSSPNLFSGVTLKEGSGGDLEIEERFYLEPVDDEENNA